MGRKRKPTKAQGAGVSTNGRLLGVTAVIALAAAVACSVFFSSSVKTQRPTETFTFSQYSGTTRGVRFVKALVLTLPRAKKRQASVRRNLGRYKMPPIEHVDAVDVGPLKAGCHAVPDTRPGKPEGWLTFNKECMQRRMAVGVDEKAADQMPHGHVAITATWIKALRRVVAMPEAELGEGEMVYIFEDDVRVQNAPPGTDFTHMPDVPHDAELLDLGKGEEARSLEAGMGDATYHHTFGGALVHALAFSRRGAEKALRVLTPAFYATIDVVLLSHLRGFDYKYTTRWSERATGSSTPQQFEAIFKKHGYDYMAKKRDIVGYTLEPCLFTQTSFSAGDQCRVHTKPLDWGTEGSKTQQHGQNIS
eukprot:g6398.t1